MADHNALNIPAFRAMFSAFADAVLYPDDVLNMWYANATLYISEYDSNSGGLSGNRLDLALNLLTAHLLQLSGLIASGQTPSRVNGSSIDKISVTLQPPPIKTQWQFWLSTSPYGQQLWAFLTLQSGGGWTVGGRPEQAAFRKVGGLF